MKHYITSLSLMSLFVLDLGLTSFVKAAEPHITKMKGDLSHHKDRTEKKKFTQGIFIKGRYIFDNAHKEPYFVFVGRDKRLLVLAFDEQLESEISHLVPGKEIYAFVGFNDRKPEKSEVIFIGKDPDKVHTCKLVYALKDSIWLPLEQPETYDQIFRKLEAIPSLQELIAEEKAHLQAHKGKEPAEKLSSTIESLLNLLEQAPPTESDSSLSVQSGGKQRGSIKYTVPHQDG